MRLMSGRAFSLKLIERKTWLILEGTEELQFFVLTFILPFIYLFGAMSIAKFRGFTYKVLVIFSFLDILDFATIFLFIKKAPIFFNDILGISIVNVIIAFVLLFLAMALDKRMNSLYTTKFEKYTTKEGKKKTRIRYIMGEEYSPKNKK